MNRIKELRTKYGLSLRKLQEYTSIDFSRLAVIEKTNANIETKTLEKLIKFFNVSITYLLGFDGFIFYYDEKNHNYFPLLFEQYKAALSDDVISFSIVEGCIRRIISLDGYERINKLNEITETALNARISTEKFLKHLNELDFYEFNRQKEIILEFFEMKELEDKRKNK